MESLAYTGTELKWHGRGTFKAASGMKGYQYPEDQCVPDKGPVPEGKYYIPLILGALAEDDGSGFCVLKPSWQVQEIPRGESAGECDPYWDNWGYNRVRFEPYDEVTKKDADLREVAFTFMIQLKDTAMAVSKWKDASSMNLERLSKKQMLGSLC